MTDVILLRNIQITEMGFIINFFRKDITMAEIGAWAWANVEGDSHAGKLTLYPDAFGVEHCENINENAGLDGLQLYSYVGGINLSVRLGSGVLSVEGDGSNIVMKVGEDVVGLVELYEGDCIDHWGDKAMARFVRFPPMETGEWKLLKDEHQVISKHRSAECSLESLGLNSSMIFSYINLASTLTAGVHERNSILYETLHRLLLLLVYLTLLLTNTMNIDSLKCGQKQKLTWTS